MNFDLQAFMDRHGIQELPQGDENNQAVCPKHGPYTRYQADTEGPARGHHRCPHCVAQELESERQRRVPKRYRDARLEGPMLSDGERTSARILSALQPVDLPNIWLFGPVGTGKTHLGHALCRDIVRQGHKAILKPLRELLAEVRACWKPGAGERADAVLARYAQIPVLVLDEIDKVNLFFSAGG